jgi:NitT/TauT family transport system ATP-binding protein
MGHTGEITVDAAHTMDVHDESVCARLSSVGLTYPTGTVALADLSLTIPAGRVTGVVGPSGCGKSTMLQLLPGLAKPTVGTCEVMLERDDERHDVAFVFQQDTLLPWLTVRQNVGLYYRFHRPKDRKKVDAEITELLAMGGLQEFANSYPGQLSGGMRRRAIFLAAVAPKPRLLLLDEPFSSVDEPTRIGIHQEVVRIVNQFDMTVVLVTHDLAEAVSLSDQVVIFSARPGQVVSTHDIPFGRDRNILALRDDPEFLSLYGRLWRDLSEQIVRAQIQHDDS